MMVASLASYEPVTFLLTDQSALLRFYPDRDGPITDDWNVTYTDSNFADWSYDHNIGSGNSSHRTTFKDASLVIDWAGTEIYLYGELGSAGAFEAHVDGKTIQPTTDSLYPSLIFNKTDLAYGLHTAIFNVTAGEMIVTGAAITVNMSGMGVPTLHNIYPVDSSTSLPTVNPFFAADTADWSATTLYTNQTADGYPCLTTSTYGAKLNFTLSGIAAFILAGSCDWMQGLYTVAVSSDTPGATSSIPDNAIQYSARSLWTQENMFKYMAAGLDKNATYTVEITNLGDNFNLAAVYVYDVIPASEPSSSPPSSQSSHSPASTGGSPSSSNAPKSKRRLAVMKLSGCLLLILVVALL